MREDGIVHPISRRLTWALQTLLPEAPAYMRPLIRFLYTGMRVMEPDNMTWGEVNLKHGELRISGRRTKNGQQKSLVPEWGNRRKS